MIWLFLSFALAQDTYEIVVWGEAEVLRARAALMREVEAQGWKVKEKEDFFLFKPPRNWIGKGVFHSEGLIRFRRPIIGFQPSDNRTYPPFDPDTQMGEMPLYDSQVGFWLFPAAHTRIPAQERLLKGIEPELHRYLTILQNTHFQEQLGQLVERLEALWKEGKPLEGEEVLNTVEAKRRAILDYWASRANTPEGNAVSHTIEVWLREIAQNSSDPVTETEKNEAEAKRLDGRKLSLE